MYPHVTCLELLLCGSHVNARQVCLLHGIGISCRVVQDRKARLILHIIAIKILVHWFIISCKRDNHCCYCSCHHGMAYLAPMGHIPLFVCCSHSVVTVKHSMEVKSAGQQTPLRRSCHWHSAGWGAAQQGTPWTPPSWYQLRLATWGSACSRHTPLSGGCSCLKAGTCSRLLASPLAWLQLHLAWHLPAPWQIAVETTINKADYQCPEPPSACLPTTSCLRCHSCWKDLLAALQ